MINRPEPRGSADQYQTYRIAVFQDIEIKSVCEEVDCDSWRHGWETVVDERTPLGTAQAQYIRTRSGRTHREARTDTGLTVFRFESGQRCFAEHHTRPEVFSRHPGWQERQTGPAYIHPTAADWQEDFGEHQSRIADEIRKG